MKRLLVALAVALSIAAFAHAEKPKWKTWTVETKQSDGAIERHVWRTVMINGAMHGIYLNDEEHAITISNFNGEPFVRWSANYEDESTRPPFPYSEALKHYGFRN